MAWQVPTTTVLNHRRVCHRIVCRDVGWFISWIKINDFDFVLRLIVWSDAHLPAGLWNDTLDCDRRWQPQQNPKVGWFCGWQFEMIA